jgi:hypothetical protein
VSGAFDDLSDYTEIIKSLIVVNEKRRELYQKASMRLHLYDFSTVLNEFSKQSEDYLADLVILTKENTIYLVEAKVSQRSNMTTMWETLFNSLKIMSETLDNEISVKNIISSLINYEGFTEQLYQTVWETFKNRKFMQHSELMMLIEGQHEQIVKSRDTLIDIVFQNTNVEL